MKTQELKHFKKGDKLFFVIKPSLYSYTLFGKEKGWELAHNGRVFTVDHKNSHNYLECGEWVFSPQLFFGVKI